MAIDAALFAPQSRPRLFVVAVARGIRVPAGLRRVSPDPVWTSAALGRAHAALPEALRQRWVWWAPPVPPLRNDSLADLIEDDPTDTPWLGQADVERLLWLMAPAHRAAVEAARRRGPLRVGTVYRRTRVEAGKKVQRAEVRFDGLAGCLRTPGGGSSRQFVLIIEGGALRARLLSGREAARLMGLPETYRLPARYNEAYHLVGDGVAVPVVRHLAHYLLEPLVAGMRAGAVAV